VTAALVSLLFDAVEGVIIVGVVLALIRPSTRLAWTRHPLVRALILLARGLCAPARMLMKRLGLPLAPLDFSPVVTVFALRVVQWLVVSFLRLFP
jgi:uncharacterized protein YggT (Ycf19 family)